MTTIVFDTTGRCVSQSRNLRGLFDWARRAGGVTRLECHTFPYTRADYPLSPGGQVVRATRPQGYLIAHLANGYRAETWFSCGAHLEEWARDRAKQRLNSWFAGASVDVTAHDEWENWGERK